MTNPRIYTEPTYHGHLAYLRGEDDAGPDSPTGWGRTPAAAIEDLLAQLQDIIVRVR